MATLAKEYFPEMLERIPALVPRLVSIMSDRIRESTKAEDQRQKLAALGKLSAGLAHELNNPAAAARRAAESMRHAIGMLRQADEILEAGALNVEQRAFLASLHEPRALDDDPLARSDREDSIGRWLEKHDVPKPWELAGSLADAGFDTAVLEDASRILPVELLGGAMLRVAASLAVDRLVNEIENSTSRISELVRAIKEYSYMDQGPVQEIDVHQGLESTLLILKHRLKQGVHVVREYDRTLPPVCARGSELNQVWTNLIDNAIDAMEGKGELRIRTGRELDKFLVEIADTGPGIPREVQERMFEPFFTTKGAGKGTGLGLDAVYRIVRVHHGEVRVQSKPGDTRFQVLLPFGIPTVRGDGSNCEPAERD